MMRVCPRCSRACWSPLALAQRARCLPMWVAVGMACCLGTIGCRPTVEQAVELQPVRYDLADRAEPPQATAEDRAHGELTERLERVLAVGSKRILSASRHAAWQIMHGVLCYGPQLQLDTPDRGRVGALDYLLSGGQVQGFELMLGDLFSDGRLRGVQAKLEPGSYQGQGHVDQWIAIMAMADIPLDTPIQLGEVQTTVEGLARQAQYDVSRNLLDEYSWTLIALTHYFPHEPRWVAWGDYEVSWEMLVEQELRRELDTSPCGGTHRMAGLVAAVNAHRRLGLPDSPIWQAARERIERMLERVEQLRLPDGNLSAYYFAKLGASHDVHAQLASTGHLFEFCALALPEQRLREAWVAQAATAVCRLLEVTEREEVDCGALYHALRGLKIYRARITR
ncbi:MAG: hypothetical protein KatS3mg111_2205 [Pirellulaceae bacterium]|nr:MAG: hypothetical protein KatS3mg111_2205 [Pirellulaceae bacterium]